MRNVSWMIGVAALVVASSVGIVVGCSSDANPIIAAPDGSASSSGDATTTTSSSSSSGGSPEAGSSSGDPGDGGPPEAAAPTPNSVACGTSSCSVINTAQRESDDICCVSRDGGAMCDQPQCGQQVVNSQIVVQLQAHCDDRTDCPTGTVCCLHTNHGGPSGRYVYYDTECEASCTGTPTGDDSFAQGQICLVDEECGTGVSCLAATCDGFDVHMCGGADAGRLCN